MIKRDIEKVLLSYAKFPVVGVFGPRQSGKTTLVQMVFKKHRYVNFENPVHREFAKTDPEGFLREYENKDGIILDEFQYVPEIVSYIQLAVDQKKQPGHFVLTGSQNFLMNQAVSQSLAGRIGILTLLPLSLNELKHSKKLSASASEMVFAGGYPRIYADNILPEELYPSYIHTYVERDVRQLSNIENLHTFQKFMQLCAGRVGQQLNVTDLATVCGIHRKTAEHWLSILEASFVLFFLRPYWENFSKRVTKTPKLYFYDTGLASSLLDIKSASNLALSSFRGALFENLIIADLHKQYLNAGSNPPLYFWRDKNGLIEIDCLINTGTVLIPVEIKSGETASLTFFNSITKWCAISGTEGEKSYVVYGGASSSRRKIGSFISWHDAGDLVAKAT